MVELHRKCAKLVEEGKIDKEYSKDIQTRVRNSPLLALWMVSMALYTAVLKDIPDTIDKVKNKFKQNPHKDIER